MLRKLAAVPLLILLAGCGGAAAPAGSTAASAVAKPASSVAASAAASASAKPAASALAKPAASGAAEAKPAASAEPVVFSAGAAPAQVSASCSGPMRKITLGVSVAPPNVVHTPPFIARGLGIFAKRCIDAEIVQFEGGLSQTNITAVARGSVMSSINATAIGQGIKAHQLWGMAPRLPQAYVVGPDIKTAADLKGKKLSAAGGGVGSFNWVMGREVLKTANLTVDDAQFISQGTAGRLPGLISGQIDGVALHPEDVYLAQKQKPGVHILVNLSELLPKYYFNAYGVADDFLNRDRKLVLDATESLIEANRAIYQQKDKVIPIMAQATEKPKEAVDVAYDFLTKNCVWSVNTGFNRERVEWSIQNAIENGDIEASKKPTYEQVVDEKFGSEALAAVGGPTTIGGCKD